jgi:hypothetical protein
MTQNVAGPFVPTLMGAGVWVGIPDELPQAFLDKKVWVTTENPESFETRYQVALMDGKDGWQDVTEAQARRAKLAGLIVRMVQIKKL